MRGAALLDENLGNAKFPRQALRSNQRRVSLPQGDNGFRAKFGKNNLFLGPDPAFPSQPVIEKLSPLLSRSLLKGRDIVAHFEQAATLGASIKDFLEGVSDTTPGEAFKPCS